MAVVGVQGPTVTAPIGGVEPALATAALGSAVALNEASRATTGYSKGV